MEGESRYLNKHPEGPFDILEISDDTARKLTEAGFNDFTDLLQHIEEKLGYPIDDTERGFAEKGNDYFRVLYAIPGITQQEASLIVENLMFDSKPILDS